MFTKIKNKLRSRFMKKIDRIEDESLQDAIYNEENCAHFETKLKIYNKKHGKSAKTKSKVFNLSGAILLLCAPICALVGAVTLNPAFLIAGLATLALATSAEVVNYFYNKKVKSIETTQYYMDNKDDINNFAEFHSDFKEKNPSYSLQRENNYVSGADKLTDAYESNRGLNIRTIIEKAVTKKELEYAKLICDYMKTLRESYIRAEYGEEEIIEGITRTYRNN